MDYVILPINEDIHWYFFYFTYFVCFLRYLAAIINPKAGIVNNPSTSDLKDNFIASDSSNFHIIIFDSLIEAAENKHSLVLEHVAEYLALEYADKKVENSLPGDRFNKAAAKLIIPKGMPQQKNFVDCGLFLLQFAEIFMTNPPMVFFKIKQNLKIFLIEKKIYSLI